MDAPTAQLGPDEAPVLAARLPETYQWLLVPEQVNPQAPVTWQATRLSGSEALAARASRKLRSEELLVTSLGSTILRKHLDDVPLWRGDHVASRQLVEDFAQYLYLPQLAGPEVLLRAIRDGVGLLMWQSDTFAYAESHDEAAGLYRGLRGGQNVSFTADDAGLLVKPAAARQPGSDPDPDPDPEPKPTLDPARVGRDASRIADEVVAHLVGQVGAEVTVTLEIHASLPDGAFEQNVRTVTENSRTLKFTSHSFEAE